MQLSTRRMISIAAIGLLWSSLAPVLPACEKVDPDPQPESSMPVEEIVREGADGDAPAAGVLSSGVQTTDWVSIPGGTFDMGRCKSGKGEKPVHPVTVSAFEMSRTEVTVTQYERCHDAGACPTPRTQPFCNWLKKGKENHPINCVDWDGAVAYAAWASDNGSPGARLPTEAEFEYASRGGEDFVYSGSDDPDEVACWNRKEPGQGTCEVASKKPNGYGLYDMSGNLWEWCSDWHGPYESSTDPVVDPQGPAGGESKIVRGGEWNIDDEWKLHSSTRGWHERDAYVIGVGFRLARSAERAPAVKGGLTKSK